MRLKQDLKAEVQVETMENPYLCHWFLILLSYLSYTAQVHLLKDYTTHSAIAIKIMPHIYDFGII